MSKKNERQDALTSQDNRHELLITPKQIEGTSIETIEEVLTREQLIEKIKSYGEEEEFIVTFDFNNIENNVERGRKQNG